jgi:hypothetical protein
MTTKSAGELADWILENRKGNAFKGDTWENLVAGLSEDSKHNNMVYVLNDSGNIIGIMTYMADRVYRILFVKNILITKHSALSILAEHVRENFEGFDIAGNRDNDTIYYNMSRLINILVPERKA